jgi:hypothetical protein
MGVREDGSHAGDDDDHVDGKGVKGAEDRDVDASDCLARPLRVGNDTLNGMNFSSTLKKKYKQGIRRAKQRHTSQPVYSSRFVCDAG